MAERERGNELYDLPKPGEKEHHPEQEQQVIVTRDHVDGAGDHEVERRAIRQTLRFSGGHPVRKSGNRADNKTEQHQEQTRPNVRWSCWALSHLTYSPLRAP